MVWLWVFSYDAARHALKVWPMTREEFVCHSGRAVSDAIVTMQPQDIYKLIYQAVFGPEHSVTHWRAAAENLYLEILHLPETSAVTAIN